MTPMTDTADLLWVIALVPLATLLIDRCFGEPPSRLHPVVWMGRLLSTLERGLCRPSNRCQVLVGCTAWCLGAIVCTAVALSIQAWVLDQELPFLAPWVTILVQIALLALLLKPMLALRLLTEEALTVDEALARSLSAARRQTARLCSRDTTELQAGELRETAIESLAENLVDSVVAPLFWFAVAGLPGAALYRWANTADAMWGYRSARYERFGKSAARIDDVLNWIPARLCALLLWPWGRGRCLRKQAVRTASPNGGWPMAAVALSLDVRLRKTGSYVLNENGRDVVEGDIASVAERCHRAAVLCSVLSGLFACLLAAVPMAFDVWVMHE